MNDEIGKEFNYLNKYSYLLKIVVEQNGLSIIKNQLNDTVSYHLCYGSSILANLSFLEDEVNITIYKYFSFLSKKVYNVKFSEFFDPERFRFEDFTKYCNLLKYEFDNLNKKEDEPESKDISLVDQLKQENMELKLQISKLHEKLWKIFLNT